VPRKKFEETAAIEVTLGEMGVSTTTRSQSPMQGTLEFRGWYEAHIAYVWGSLRRLGVPPSDLADLCHDVFVVAWRQRAHLEPDRPAKAWLFGVAFRVAASHRRRSWFRKRKDYDIDLVNAPGISPEEQALQRAEFDRLYAALDQVPLKLRGVLLLHDFDEVPLKEIAGALEIPLQTVYSRLSLARKRFRQAFRQGELHNIRLTKNPVVLGEQR
jgi:RNA polymerase sigma-70 factor, ECF subfamily